MFSLINNSARAHLDGWSNAFGISSSSSSSSCACACSCYYALFYSVDGSLTYAVLTHAHHKRSIYIVVCPHRWSHEPDRDYVSFNGYRPAQKTSFRLERSKNSGPAKEKQPNRARTYVRNIFARDHKSS